MIKIRSGPVRASLGDVTRRLNLREMAPIVIGLVNNMPDAALQATERQFCDLLAEASRDLLIVVRFFSIPQLRRSEAGRTYVSQHYEDIGEMFADRLDGLIVTGTEPHALVLSDEPYWPTMTKVVDWAEDHTTSTVWSCLAAHAAVLHLDGIQRRPFREKLWGVFECAKVADHVVVSGSAPQWCMPHSRYNDLSEQELVSKDYCIVSRSPEAGADMFVKQRRSLSIYLQGHPEYDPEALFREYRRDFREFVAGERDRYPDMPRGYFHDETAAEFDEFRRRTLRTHRTDIALNFPQAERKLAHDWHEPAVRLYTNWLSYLVEHRHPGDRSRAPHSANASQAA
ncbi:MAG: homoserine O-succinyltransferase [Candidatus Binatus sp.]